MKRHHRIIRVAAALTVLLLGAAAYAAFNPAFAATCKTLCQVSVTWIGERAHALTKALSQPASYAPSRPAPKTLYDDDPDAKSATEEISFTSAANRWKKRDPAPRPDDGDEAEDEQSAR